MDEKVVKNEKKDALLEEGTISSRRCWRKSWTS